MKHALGAIIAALVLSMATAALAQTGLYGSPALIPLPTAGTATPQYVYPSTSAPSTLPAVRPAAAGYAGVTPTAAYKEMPASFGATTGGPALFAEQDSRNFVAQATAEPPLKPTPETFRPEVPPPAPNAVQEPVPPSPAATPAAPGVLDQLLRESGSTPGPACQAATGGAACGDSADCQGESCVRCPWYFSAAGLVLTRDHANRIWTTYETGNNANQLMNTEEAKTGWDGGAQFTLGRRFCCDTWAVEGTFWGLANMTGFASRTAAGGGLSTPLDFTDVRYESDPAAADGDPHLPVYLFDAADAHFIRRTDEVYNVELNLLRLSLQACNDVKIDWLVGARWFHFREHLTFGSCDQGGSWSDPLTTGYLDERIKNDLIGAQVGLNADWYLGYQLSLFARPKIGIYNNHIDSQFNACGGGEEFVPRAGSGVFGTYPTHADKNAVSFLTEIDLGLNWQFHPQWSAFAGYRVLFATNMGLADHQFPHYVVDIPELETIHDNGDLLLHGAFAGLQFNF